MPDRPLNLKDWQVRAAREGRLSVLVVPITPSTCTVLGSRWSAKDAAWRGLLFDHPAVKVRTTSTLMDAVVGPKDAPYDLHLDVPFVHPDDAADGMRWEDDPCMYRVRPIIEVGDRYWVRETWAKTSIAPIVETIDNPWTVYRVGDNRTDYGGPWKSSAVMPRRFSRLTLIPTSIRVCRVQEVTRDEAIAAGATSRPACDGFQRRYDGWSMDWSDVGKVSRWAWAARNGEPAPLTERDVCLGTPQAAFANKWIEQHGERGYYANPWVCIATVDVHHRNIDSMEE